MTPLFVVPGKPVFQVFGKFSAGFVRLQADLFALERFPEPFDENVVFETSFAVQADFYVPGFQQEFKDKQAIIRL